MYVNGDYAGNVKKLASLAQENCVEFAEACALNSDTLKNVNTLIISSPRVVQNSNSNYAIFSGNYNRIHPALKNLSLDKGMRFYSGALLIVDPAKVISGAVEPMIYGVQGCYSYDSDGQKDVEVVGTESDMLLMVSENLSGGGVAYICGTTFYNDYEIAYDNLEIPDGLIKSFASIAIPVNKSALAASITLAEDKKGSDYTETSWKAFAAALSSFKTVYADNAAAQAEVNAALSSLNDATDGLIAVSAAKIEINILSFNDFHGTVDNSASSSNTKQRAQSNYCVRTVCCERCSGK